MPAPVKREDNSQARQRYRCYSDGKITRQVASVVQQLPQVLPAPATHTMLQSACLTLVRDTSTTRQPVPRAERPGG